MEGTLFKYQKVKQAIGHKKWVKYSAQLTGPTQTHPAYLFLTEKEKKGPPIKLNNTCTAKSMPPQHKGRDNTFELVCTEEKVHLLAAECSDSLPKWLHKLHEVAGVQLSGGGGGGGGGGCGKTEKTPGPPSNIEPADADLQDNLLYDSCETKTFPVTIKENAFTESLDLHGAYTLLLDTMKLSLIDPNVGQILFSWPYRYLRRYGREQYSFSMEVGRRCTSGEGLIRFNVTDGNEVFFAVQEYVSAMSGRNFSSTSPGQNAPASSPVTAPIFPPSFNSYTSEPKQVKGNTPPANRHQLTAGGVKVLPTMDPRDRTHSTGSRTIQPKPSFHPQLSNRGAQSVDDITSSGAQNNDSDEFYAAVSDEAVDRSKLPSPKTQRSADFGDFEPEQHYDVASEPAPKHWPQPGKKEGPEGKVNGVKMKPKPSLRTDKSAAMVETVASDVSAVSLEDTGDPGVYGVLDQPPGAAAPDSEQVYAEADDHGHIYDHLARQQLANTVAAPRLPPPNAKPGTAPKAAAASASAPASKATPPVEDCDMLYDHLDRGQAVGSQPGSSQTARSFNQSSGAGVPPEETYDSLSLETQQAVGGDPYLVSSSSYPPSTVPEESEYAEANADTYLYRNESPYEIPEEK